MPNTEGSKGVGLQLVTGCADRAKDPECKLANHSAMARVAQALVPRSTGVVHSNRGFGEKAEGVSEGNQD